MKLKQNISLEFPRVYSQLETSLFEQLAQLLLDAPYKATNLVAIRNLNVNGNNTLYLTLVGGGVFGNKLSWILSDIRKCVTKYMSYPLDVKINSFYSSNPYVLAFCNAINEKLIN